MEIAGPNVPSCGTGAETRTLGDVIDMVAIVKFARVVAPEKIDVLDGTTNASVWMRNILGVVLEPTIVNECVDL